MPYRSINPSTGEIIKTYPNHSDAEIGHVGLVGDRIDIPLFPCVSREQTLQGSYWGNTDLTEVMALAAQDKIRHTIKVIRFDQIKEYIELLRAGEIVGRAVVKF